MESKMPNMDVEGEAVTESTTTDDPSTGNGTEYACLFCLAGREETVVQKLLQSGRVTRATTARMVKRKTNHGQTRRVEEIMLPCYVFVEASTDMTDFPFTHGDGIIKVLYSTENDWRLYGRDQTFVQWLFARNGLLGFSEAYKDGDHVKIISGPLKDLEGAITKVDKRNTCGQLTINVGGREFRVWLGFDIVDKAI